MENYWINVYFIGFFVSLVVFLLTISGIMRSQYVWKKTFWTVPYENKNDRAAVYGTALFLAPFWPAVWVFTLFVFVTALLYWCLYHIFKKLR